MNNNIKKLADDYYRCRYFFTLNEYFEKNNITDDTIKNAIKFELSEIQKADKQKESLIDALLKSTRAFKFSQSKNRKNFFIYHPCSKKEKGFQISFFHNNEPISDIHGSTITEIKKEIMQYINRYDFIEEAIGKLV